MSTNEEWIEFERSCYLWAMLADAIGDQDHRQHFIKHAELCKQRSIECERKELLYQDVHGAGVKPKPIG
jgi:hypothetical protein